MSSLSLMNKASKNSEDMREIASRICRDYLTGAWKTIAASDLVLKRISGGLSNFLYYVSLPDDIDNCNNVSRLSPISSVKRPRKDSINLQEPKEVLLRIYGRTHGEQALETVLTDTVVFTLLSERKLGPKLHGIFPGGRIEQYIPARALSTSELGDEKISCKIAEKMAKIHSLNIPVSKEPDWLWVTMQRWLANLEDILSTYTSKSDNDMKIRETISKIDIRKELQWLKTTVETLDYPVVFCHNDLQEGNILFKEHSGSYTTGSSVEQLSTFFDDTANLDSHFDSPLLSPENQRNGNATSNSIGSRSQRKRLLSDHHHQHQNDDLDNTRDSVLSGQSHTFSDNCDPDLIIIDFEYCAYNYRGFDLANHFVEWTMDYTNKEYPFYYHKKEQYPTMEQQERFISTYLSELNSSEDYTPTEVEIEELKEEVLCFTMASHLFWSLWAFINVYQDIEFGYWPYGQNRMQEYFAAKHAFAKAKGLDLKHTHTLDDRK